MNSSNEDIALQVPTVSAVAFDDITTESIGTHVSISADDIQFVTTGILSTIFIVFGTGGNTLSILVWAGKSMKSTTGTYLIALALADLGNLWFTFFTDSIQLIYPEMKRYCQYGTFYSYIGYPGHMIFVTCSIWITVGLTADRCIKVRWMDLAQTMCSQSRALISIGVIIFVCLLINIPHFLVYEPISNCHRNETGVVYKLTAFGQTGGKRQYEFWMMCMFIALAPVTSIFIFNMLIICEVRTINRKIGSRKGAVGKIKGQKKEAQLTRLLLLVTFTFLILNSFHCIVQCFLMLDVGDMIIVTPLNHIANLMTVINSSVNFLLYCVSGNRFRRAAVKTICGRFSNKKKEKNPHTCTTTGGTSMSISATLTTTSITRSASARQ